MARRFQKIDSNATLTAPDGEISAKGISIIVGSKWAIYSPSLVTELAPDGTVEDDLQPKGFPMLYAESSTPASQAPVTGAAVGTGDGIEVNFSATLAHVTPIKAGTLTVKVDGSARATDNGEGVVSGGTGATLVTGTINYATGALALHFATAPLDTKAITADFAPSAILTVTSADFTGVAGAGVKVMKVGVILVHGTGAGKYLVTGPREVTLGTAANGSDLYTVAYLG